MTRFVRLGSTWKVLLLHDHVQVNRKKLYIYVCERLFVRFGVVRFRAVRLRVVRLRVVRFRIEGSGLEARD